MGQRHKTGPREGASEQAVRDQEVLRANRELSAYFKGRRTEREARAALKIIKAFIRDREGRDAKDRPPLPGAGIAKISKAAANRKTANASSKRLNRESPQPPESDERLPE